MIGPLTDFEAAKGNDRRLRESRPPTLWSRPAYRWSKTMPDSGTGPP